MGFLDVLLGGGIEAKLKTLERAVENSDYDSAEENLLELRAQCAKKHTLSGAVGVRLDLAEGKLRAKYQQFDRVESPVRRALNAAKGLDNKDLLRQATEAMLGCAVRAGRHAETVELAEQWISVPSADFKERVDVLLTKGTALLSLCRYEDALRSFESAQRLVESMPATPDKHERFVTAASGMGDAYLGMEDRVQAINSWRQAMSATRTQYGADHPQMAAILVCIGTEQLNADEIEPARGSFTEAVEIFRTCGHGESVGAAVALQKLALTHLMSRSYDRAEVHAKEAIRAAASHGPEVRGRAQEMLRKIEEAKRAPILGAGLPVIQADESVESMLDDLPTHDRTMFPARPVNLRQPARPGRTNVNPNWAPLGR